ncbi:MAG: hypothetical protein GY774_16475 [Planctomycetes bacterium]|nr:hypothetical protein [Planctomycetota bacterium]
MGRATIISGGTDGQYQINYNADKTRMQAKIDRIVEIITIIEEIDIPRLEAAHTVKQQAASDKLAELNAAITAGDDTTTLTGEYNIALAELAIARRNLDTKKAKLASLKQEKKFLTDNLPPPEQIPAWCADLSESLSGEVGTIEIPGERTAPVIIKPGGVNGDQAAYNASADGQIIPCLGISATENFYNLAMMPGWQKHQPTYRLGTITALNDDLCDITLDPATSSQQDLDINPIATLTDVPITYLDCHGAAFDVGDRVVVKYTGSGPGTTHSPGVIGFESNPKACCAVDFTFAPLTPSTFIQFTGIMEGKIDEIFWDFGDGSYLHTTEELDNTDPIHEYDNPGVYTVTATGIQFNETASLAQPDVPFSAFRELKDSDRSYTSYADAYALFQAASFVLISGDGGVGYFSIYGGPHNPPNFPEWWRVRAFRRTSTIPLQDIADYPSVVNGKSLIWLEGLHRSWDKNTPTTISSPVYSILSGSNLILQMREGQGISPEITPIDNSTPMIETIVRIDDDSNHPILPDPIVLLPHAPGGRVYTGWQNPGVDSDPKVIRVRPYKCIATKQKVVTVT